MDQLLGWRIRLQEDDLISQQIDHTVLFLHVSFAEHISFLGLPFLSPSLAASMTGLPPRMRGKEGGHAGSSLLLGITPAYAGKSILHPDNVCQGVDHPRVCGEKAPIGASPLPSPGSPPRMRGKDFAIDLRFKIIRITPAYAGKRRRADCQPSATHF